MDIKRIKQVVEYGWKHAGSEAVKHSGKGRIIVFFDILQCFWKYRMWSNQYIKERFWEVSNEDREIVGEKYLEAGIKRDAWQDDFRNTRKFLLEFANMKYELAGKREKRKKAYTLYYKTGTGLMVESNVLLTRQHYKDGQLSIGNDVLLSKDVDIDYTGDLIIENGVALSEGTKILTHNHEIDGVSEGRDVIITPLIIKDHVWIGARTLVLPGVKEIGRKAMIGAGSVISTKIPPYAVVRGNPAKIVGFCFSPEEIIEYEKKYYPEKDRLPIELLEKNYQKYFLDHIKDIKVYTSIICK